MPPHLHNCSTAKAIVLPTSVVRRSAHVVNQVALLVIPIGQKVLVIFMLVAGVDSDETQRDI